MVKTVCIPASDPGISEPKGQPGGQDLRDVALQLRLMLNSGTSFAIATVIRTCGSALRRPGTVVVISQSGETIGVNPAGPLDSAITDLAAKALTTGHDQLERLDIDHEAASYIGLSGGVSLDVHATRVRAADPMFGSALRYLDSGAATVLALGTCGVSGHAVIGADRLAGRLSWPDLPVQVIKDARSMLGSRRTMHRTYSLGGETGSAASSSGCSLTPRTTAMSGESSRSPQAAQRRAGQPAIAGNPGQRAFRQRHRRAVSCPP